MTQTNGYTRPFGHVIPLLCNMARSSSAEDMQLHSDPGSADCSHRRTHGHCMCPRALQNNLSTSLFTLMLEVPSANMPGASLLHTLRRAHIGHSNNARNADVDIGPQSKGVWCMQLATAALGSTIPLESGAPLLAIESDEPDMVPLVQRRWSIATGTHARLLHILASQA